MYFKDVQSLLGNRVHSSWTIEASLTEQHTVRTFVCQEWYATIADWDCRRVLIHIVDSEVEDVWAYIHLGFDLRRRDAGPYLHPLFPQSAKSDQLLSLFTHAINDDPMILARMHERYREVRVSLTGKPYRGRAFPSPGKVALIARATPNFQARGSVMARDRSLLGDHPAFPLLLQINSELVQPRDEELIWGRLVAALAKGSELVFSEEIRDDCDLLLRNYPERVWQLFHQVVGDRGDKRRQEPAAYQDMLDLFEMLLFQLKQGLERAPVHFESTLECLQIWSVEHLLVPEQCKYLQDDLLRCIGDSGLEINADMKHAYVELTAYYLRFQENQEARSLELTLDELVRSGNVSAFQFYAFLKPQLDLLTIPARLGVLRALSERVEPLWSELLVLFLLYPDSETRQATGDMLLFPNKRRTWSSVSLRRLIQLRNWVAVDERKNIDKTIRRARLRGVAIQPLEKPTWTKIWASALDGAGEQALWIGVAGEDEVQVVQLLTGLDSGIADVWQGLMENQAAVERELATIADRVEVRPVSRNYLDLTVAHHLATNLALEQPPPPGLLHLAELLGESRWSDDRLNPEQMLSWFAEQTSQLSDSAWLVENVRTSVLWGLSFQWLDSWYEESDELRDHLQGWSQPGTPDEVGNDLTNILICRNLFEKQRLSWQWRFLWAALWLKEADEELAWLQFAGLAQSIDMGTALDQIPLMLLIAQRSHQAIKSRESQPVEPAELHQQLVAAPKTIH